MYSQFGSPGRFQLGFSTKAFEETELLWDRGHGAAQPAPGTGKCGGEQSPALPVPARRPAACVGHTDNDSRAVGSEAFFRGNTASKEE